MKQYEAVIKTLEKLGGQATLAQLYVEVMKVNECKWETKTPFASIRRIVQVRPEIFKVRPGLYALWSFQQQLNLEDPNQQNSSEAGIQEQNHTYYQGLLVTIGNLRKLKTFIPNQDKNKKFLDRPIGELRTCESIPQFSYENFVLRSRTIDVIWFNERNMPHSLFEVEHSTDIQGALLKFTDLRDFYCNMIIVADKNRKREFESKLNFNAFVELKPRVKFLNYDTLVNQYQLEVFKNNHEFVI
jgi:hypothetical protein